ncbi:polyphenol oxidase family protein [Leptospira levettii]|uniref:polyphenol oxidase family protein n=1 Tax=Leptospira levettii TaxID=2023178 RepID=UPI001083C7CE|nr:polyphenol oxidase family protein [Leptospira levettii]MCW7506253.1 polyphenol oxidase family protein [Leptospira levettii]MCW7517343.1 polyphenol oxidase family protein [Leptospira levettii]TGL00911.1 laccase domain-containing protein [Leptospira levettii]TGM30535.1 laccase domain-containing protein [Leptospira levettii]TGM91346.1 laccase domain-containing protein [Leptospira levettii]
MKQSVFVSYGKITYGTFGKEELLNTSSENQMFPKTAKDWLLYTKEVFSKTYSNPTYQIHTLGQVHGDHIERIPSETNHNPVLEIKEGDGLFSSQKNQVLVVRTADCVPVFLYSTKRPFVSILHSGWKGTSLGITEKMIEKLISDGYSFEELVLELGPYIQRTHYEVGEDVAVLFDELGIDVCIPKGGGKYLLDVGLAISKRVEERFGGNIRIVNQHTDVFQSPLYFSHRTKEEGRNLNFILWES